jgi:hypothetical protein
MYTLITFGSNQQGATHWWNNQERFDTQRSAERAGLNSMPIAGVFGYVVIFEFGETSWVVVDELTPPNVSIGCKGNSYFVQPAPQLTLV